MPQQRKIIPPVYITIAATAARLFDRAGTPKRPFERSTKLVTAGPYRAGSKH